MKASSLAPGTRIRLIHMHDPYPIPDNTTGTVDYIDDGGNVHMIWDGISSSLSLIPETDQYEIIKLR